MVWTLLPKHTINLLGGIEGPIMQGKINKILLSVITLSVLGLSSAEAGTIYSFDVSDTSWATVVNGDFTGSTFFFEFDDGADLNNLNSSDLLSMGFNSATGNATFQQSSIYASNINDFFSISGGIVSLTVGGPGSAAIWCSTGCGGYSMQVGQGGATSLVQETPLLYSYAFGNTISKTFTAEASVPEPGMWFLLTMSLFTLITQRAGQRNLHRRS